MPNVGKTMSKADQSLLMHAFSLAMHAHESQTRKHSIIKGGTPYLSHLMEVSGMVLANGGTAEVAAAALLHDIFEDQGHWEPVVAQTCGEVVVSLVWECTEEGTGGEKKAPWRTRKETYIQHILTCSLGATLIKVADKLQSARELARKCRQEYGRYGVINRFGGGFAGQRWFHEQFILAAETRLDQVAVAEDEPMLIGTYALLFELTSVCKWLFAEEE